MTLMHSFSALLDKSYASHPAFGSGSSWSIGHAQQDLEKFNRLYSRMSTACSKGFPQLTDLIEAKQGLGQIMGDLRRQALDPYENNFLQELETEILRVLDHDYALFAKRRRPDIFTRAIFRKHKPFLEKLNSQRFFIDKFPEDAVKKILHLGGSHLELFRERMAVGKLTREDLSFNSGPEAEKITKILNEEFEKKGINDAVSEYMNQPMQVGGQAFELSVSQAQWWRNGFIGLSRTPDTLYAHLDESIGAPKAIVYLTDVTVDNGPTGYYQALYERLGLNPLQEIIGRVLANIGGATASPLMDYYKKAYHQSMTSENFRRHFMLLPNDIRFNSHFGWDIFPGSEAESAMKGLERKMTGPAGTFLVFDGSKLLHRGGLVNQGERIALQVVFGSARRPKLRKRIASQYLPY